MTLVEKKSDSVRTGEVRTGYINDITIHHLGLDAFTSFELVKTLEKYARLNDKTVVLSIHQPRSEIFHLLSASGGQLVLLAQGDVVYSGPLDQALPWFESVGMGPCSKNINPFD